MRGVHGTNDATVCAQFFAPPILIPVIERSKVFTLLTAHSVSNDSSESYPLRLPSIQNESSRLSRLCDTFNSHFPCLRSPQYTEPLPPPEAIIFSSFDRFRKFSSFSTLHNDFFHISFVFLADVVHCTILGSGKVFFFLRKKLRHANDLGFSVFQISTYRSNEDVEPDQKRVQLIERTFELTRA